MTVVQLGRRLAQPESGPSWSVTLRNGLRLMGLAIGFQVGCSLLLMLWFVPGLLQAASVLAPAFLGLYLWFGYKCRAGFWRGMAVGFVGALPGILLLGLSLVTLATTGLRMGGPFWVMVPWSSPFFGLLNTVPPFAADQWTVHAAVPLTVLVTGIGSWWGGTRQTLAKNM